MQHQAYDTAQKPLDMFANKSLPLSPTDGVQVAEISMSGPPGHVANINNVENAQILSNYMPLRQRKTIDLEP